MRWSRGEVESSGDEISGRSLATRNPYPAISTSRFAHEHSQHLKMRAEATFSNLNDRDGSNTRKWPRRRRCCQVMTSLVRQAFCDAELVHSTLSNYTISIENSEEAPSLNRSLLQRQCGKDQKLQDLKFQSKRAVLWGKDTSSRLAQGSDTSRYSFRIC